MKPYITTAITSTTISTTLTTTTVATAVVVVPNFVSFSLATGPSTRCTYNEYYSYISAPNDPGPAGDYKTGIAYCREACAQDARCKFFFFYRSDPAFRNQGDTSAYCIIDDVLFHADVQQCNVPFVLYFIGYNKN
ncbi:MAG: hypothetical protein M1829_000656 [Trizodia sp. TS-e1964]|nr:MAG: hypothetical protein M1829_000656 [Trizodia sp. TS-e1964]